MARILARLPQGARITDYISWGVVAQWLPRSTVDRVLANSGKSSRRQRDLPAHVVVYYVIAMALYMQVSYRRGAALLARSGPGGRRGPGPAFLCARGANDSAQAAAGGGAPPLGLGKPFIAPSCGRCSRNE